MREILFRGKTGRDNPHFVYGDLIHNPDGGVSIKVNAPEHGRTSLFHRVYSETVGQFTGMIDKNGKRIFEGDVVRYIETDARGNWICTDIVEFTEGSFSPIPTSYSCGDEYYSFALHSFEVIGNRWDNPELLKGGAKDG